MNDGAQGFTLCVWGGGSLSTCMHSIVSILLLFPSSVASHV